MKKLLLLVCIIISVNIYAQNNWIIGIESNLDFINFIEFNGDRYRPNLSLGVSVDRELNKTISIFSGVRWNNYTYSDSSTTDIRAATPSGFLRKEFIVDAAFLNITNGVSIHIRSFNCSLGVTNKFTTKDKIHFEGKAYPFLYDNHYFGILGGLGYTYPINDNLGLELGMYVEHHFQFLEFNIISGSLTLKYKL